MSKKTAVKRRFVGVRVPPALAEKLEQMADRADVSQNELMCRLIEGASVELVMREVPTIVYGSSKGGD